MFKDFKPEIKLFLLVALIAIVISIAGILLLKSMQPSPVVQTPPPAPSPQAQVLDTSNWQTYRSDEFGFEVRYPLTWEFLETDDEVSFKDSEVEYGFEGSPLSSLTWISVQAIPEGYDTIENYAQSRYRPNYKDEMETLTISRSKAITLSDYLRTETVIFHEGKVYTVYMPNIGYSEVANVYRGILGTFRFID